MKTARDYQSEKPFAMSSRPFGTSHAFLGDTRFRDYAQALKDGALDVCAELKRRWAGDDELMAKFSTLERIWKVDASGLK